MNMNTDMVKDRSALWGSFIVSIKHSGELTIIEKNSPKKLGLFF